MANSRSLFDKLFVLETNAMSHVMCWGGVAVKQGFINTVAPRHDRVQISNYLQHVSMASIKKVLKNNLYC